MLYLESCIRSGNEEETRTYLSYIPAARLKLEAGIPVGEVARFTSVRLWSWILTLKSGRFSGEDIGPIQILERIVKCSIAWVPPEVLVEVDGLYKSGAALGEIAEELEEAMS